MGLLSFIQRRNIAGSPVPETSPDAVQAARVRARRRLIGASVLLGIAVVAFPLLLETQPRPVALDVPIEIPRRDGGPPLGTPVMRSAPLSAPTTGGKAPVEPMPGPAGAELASTVITEPAGQQGREIDPPTRPASPAMAASEAKVMPAIGDESQRVRSLLEGQPEAKASTPTVPRFVVQVGAFTDAAALRETRQRVEKLGLKTYTQVIESDGSRRTRIRIGPYESREEADRAAVRLKAAGLAAVILSLGA